MAHILAQKKIIEFFGLLKKRRLYIQTHDIPDPDAIASAEAFRLIAKSFGGRAKIVSNGLPHRRENITLLKEGKISITPLKSLVIKSPEHSAWAFIDCLPGGGNVTLHPLAPGDLYIAIDHHGKPNSIPRKGENAFYIHDSHAGATATILGELLLGFDIPFPPRLASALSYAIISDTQDFNRGASKKDISVYADIFPKVNHRLISRIRNTTKPRDFFRTIYNSLGNAEYYRHIAWVRVGEVKSGEIVAQMADFILSTERITWSLALGYTDDKLYLSLRSSNPKAQCGHAIRRIVPRSPFNVGGHDLLAGGHIPIDSSTDVDSLMDSIIKRFIRNILRIPSSAKVPGGSLLIGL
ncbi:DHHA1 domain-containing protein [bacterium]|nr:DHHA1 domain-containing protein [bacterium]